MGEPPVGIEPTTPSLPWRCSATELQGRRGYVPRRVNDSQGWWSGCLRPPGFRHVNSTIGGCGSDSPSWPTPRPSVPSTTSRCSGARIPSTWCPAARPSRRPGSSSTAVSTRPSWPPSRPDPGQPGRIGANGEIVLGFGSLSAFRERSGYSATAENSVYVDRAQRGKGVGKALLAELLVLASAHGFHSVIARIAGHNETSIGLHEAAGFELVGVEREVGPQAPPVARRGRAPAPAVALAELRLEEPLSRVGSGLERGAGGRQGRQPRAVEPPRGRPVPQRDDGHGPEHHDGQDHAGRVRVHQFAQQVCARR